MSNPSPTNGREGRTDSGLHLPSFQDLVSFSKSASHADVVGPSLRRREDTDAVPSRQCVDRPHDQIDVERASHTSQRQFESTPSAHPYTLVRPGQERRMPASQTVSPYASNGLTSHHSQRGEALRGLSSIVAHKRSHDRMDDISSQMRRPQDHNISLQRRQIQAERPTSSPMKRSTMEHRQTAPGPSTRLPSRSDDVSTAAHSTRYLNEERRPLPIQPIPSQGSRVTSQSPQQYHSEILHSTHTEQLVARQRQNAQYPSQALPPESSRSYAHPSPRARVASFDQPRKDSPSFPSHSFHTNRGVIVSSSHVQIASPRLPMLNNQARMFDYSCALLPDERRFATPSTSMQPPQSGTHGVQSRQDTSHANGRAGTSEPQQQSGSSIVELAEQRRRHDLSRHPLAREGIHDLFRTPRCSNDVPRSPIFEQEQAMLTNRQLLHRTSTSVDLRTRNSTPLREHRSLQTASTHRGESAHSAPEMQNQHVSRAVQGVPRDVQFLGQRLISNGERAERSWNEIERRSHAMLSQRQEISASRKTPIDHHQQLWKEQQNHRLRLEEEYLRSIEHRHPTDRQQDSWRDGLDRRNDAGQEQVRRAPQQVQARMRHQSMTPPSHYSRHEGLGQVRAPASSPAWAERQIEHPVFYEAVGSGRSVRPELPSPHSVRCEPSGIDASYQRKERFADDNNLHRSHAQGRHAEMPQRTINGSSRYLAEPERTAHSYRGDQGPAPAMDRTRALTKRLNHAAEVYRTDASVRYSDRTQAPDVDQLGRETKHLRDLGTPNVRPRQPPGSDHPPPQHKHRPQQHPSGAQTPEPSQPRPTQRICPHPPVIASQNTNMQPGGTVQRPVVPTSPANRPQKRLRSGSDTSLVLKTPRSTAGAEDEAPRHSPASVDLPFPSDDQRGRRLVEMHRTETSRMSSEARFHPEISGRVNGSAPITPPPSK